MRTYGFDISKWQKHIDWKKINTEKYKFVIIRASYVNKIDPIFIEHYNHARKSGIYTGAYHYFSTFDDPERQAEVFLKALDSVGGLSWDDLPPVLDIESDETNDNEHVANSIKKWIDIVESATGKKVMIYTYALFWDRYKLEQFSNHPLWVAHYTTGNPNIPKGWDKWDFWQYTGSGSISGINVNVDKNLFRGDLDELKQFIESCNILSDEPDDISLSPISTDLSIDDEHDTLPSVIQLSLWQRIVLFVMSIISKLFNKKSQKSDE